MNGKVFVTVFLFVALAFFLFASLFMLFPPAANSLLTAVGAVLYLAIAVLVVRRVGRQGRN